MLDKNDKLLATKETKRLFVDNHVLIFLYSGAGAGSIFFYKVGSGSVNLFMYPKQCTPAFSYVPKL